MVAMFTVEMHGIRSNTVAGLNTNCAMSTVTVVSFLVIVDENSSKTNKVASAVCCRDAEVNLTFTAEMCPRPKAIAI